MSKETENILGKAVQTFFKTYVASFVSMAAVVFFFIILVPTTVLLLGPLKSTFFSDRYSLFPNPALVA